MFRIKTKTILTWFYSGFSLFLFCITFWGIKYTDDWKEYFKFFTNPELSPDILFLLLTYLFGQIGYSYVEVFQFHILFIGLFYIYFISRFTRKVTLITLLLILGSFVTIANQIRYHLAFSLFLVSAYYFFLSIHKKKAIALMIISLLSNKAIAPLYALFFIYRFVSKFSTRQMHLYTIIAGGGLFLIFKFFYALNLGRFQYYFGENWQSSLLGGIYNAIPILTLYVIITFKNSFYKTSFPALYNDPKYRFLFVLSTYSFVFIFVSLNVQIFAHRYIYFFYLVWLVITIYPLSISTGFRNRFSIVTQAILLPIFFFIWQYILPYFVFGESENIRKIMESINSYKL